MKFFCMTLLLMIPGLAFADCILTEHPFQVVCSGYNPLDPPKKKHSGKISARNNHSRKVIVTDTASSGIAMTEEELLFMQKRNQADGQRSRLKNRVASAQTTRSDVQ